MDEINEIEQIVIPEIPDVISNQQILVYIPIATTTTPGIAKYDPYIFTVIDGQVSIKKANNDTYGIIKGNPEEAFSDSVKVNIKLEEGRAVDIFVKTEQKLTQIQKISIQEYFALIENHLNNVIDHIQYMDEHSVFSVNGKTGIVTLTTEDINAYDKDEIDAKVNVINQNLTNVTNQSNTNKQDISNINSKIPSSASRDNQLADKDFVNSTMNTNLAHFRGTFEDWTSVPIAEDGYKADPTGNKKPTVNDYIGIQDVSDYHSDEIFTKDGSTQGKAISENGTIIDEALFSYTDKLTIDNFDRYIIVDVTAIPSSNIRVHAYDNNDNWLGQVVVAAIPSTETHIVVNGKIPERTSYLRVSYPTVATVLLYTHEIIGTWRFRYTGTWSTNGKNGWSPEMLLNDTPFTDAQNKAINSGITVESVEQINTNKTDIQNLAQSTTEKFQEVDNNLENVAYIEKHEPTENVDPWQNYYTKSETNNLISNPNLLINSDFRVNQRGLTSYTGSGTRLYTVDRWAITSSASVTSINTQSISVSFNGQYQAIGQKIEDFEKLKGKTLTLSCKISNYVHESGYYLYLRRADGVENTSTQITRDGIIKHTFVLGQSATQLEVQIFSGTGAGKQYSFELEYMKLEIGSVATPFSPRPYAEELALCQRYYYVMKATNAYSNYANVIYYSTTACRQTLNFPQTMRITPTFSQQGNFQVTTSSGNRSINGWNYQGFFGNAMVITVNTEAVPIYTVGILQANNDSNTSLRFDAEIY